MISRRSFIAKSALAASGLSLAKCAASAQLTNETKMPVVISTWKHGMPANETAWEILSNDGYALDAVEAGVKVPEADPGVMSVGYGGIPDAGGKVTLDACIMNEKGDAGSVAFLQHIKHPVSVARLVMEKTPHVMLSGQGALEFALKNGFEKEKLLTDKMKARWEKWKEDRRKFSPKINIENQLDENHDTISMLALDKKGRLCGACTTSGMAFKMHGRVGDSPIIGAGLFVDGEVGGAAATGSGELVMKTLGSFLVVEFMRNGMPPAKACEEAVKRIVKKIPGYEQHQTGYIALNTSGSLGSYALQPGFDYAVKNNETSRLKEAESWLKKL